MVSRQQQVSLYHLRVNLVCVTNIHVGQPSAPFFVLCPLLYAYFMYPLLFIHSASAWLGLIHIALFRSIYRNANLMGFPSSFA